jgi:hypothetical protein
LNVCGSLVGRHVVLSHPSPFRHACNGLATVLSAGDGPSAAASISLQVAPVNRNVIPDGPAVLDCYSYPTTALFSAERLRTQSLQHGLVGYFMLAVHFGVVSGSPQDCPCDQHSHANQKGRLRRTRALHSSPHRAARHGQTLRAAETWGNCAARELTSSRQGRMLSGAPNYWREARFACGMLPLSP